MTNKYLRKIHSAGFGDAYVEADVYSVLVGFQVKCPAIAHAIKKLLCPGQRGNKNYLQDLEEARASIDRAITIGKSTRNYDIDPKKVETNPEKREVDCDPTNS